MKVTIRGELLPVPLASGTDQLTAQAVPLSVNDVGAAFVAPFVPMKPTLTEPAAGIVAV